MLWCDEHGGEVYLTQLVDKVATAAHVKHYAEIVYKKYVVRDLIRTATGLVQRCYKEEDDNPQVLIDEAADQIYKLSQKQKLLTHSTLFQELFTTLNTRANTTPSTLTKDLAFLLGLQPS